MEDEQSEMAQDAIFEIIENQMRDNTPPITKETYTRLKATGHSHEEAMKLIGCAISVELFEIMSNKQTFNEERYSKNLKNLPELPWEDD
jgi:peroxiredoxin family protein